MLSFFSFLYTSKDIPSILSYPFCIYETKSHKTVQSNPRPNVTTEAAQPYSFHSIFQVILLHLHSSFGYKIHIYATRDTMYKSKERTFVHSSRTRWFTTGLREFRASRKFPGSFPERRFGVCADPPLSNTKVKFERYIFFVCRADRYIVWSMISLFILHRIINWHL